MIRSPEGKNSETDDIVRKVQEALAGKNQTIRDLTEREKTLTKALEDAKKELVRAKEIARSHDQMIETLGNILSEDASQSDSEANGRPRAG
jgi:ABC-type transporter Mla subunit MlaD